MDDAGNDMESHIGIPPDILRAGEIIRTLRDKNPIARHDRELLKKAKLRVAYWACGTEGIMPSRENLTYVLGPDAKEIMDMYDQSLVRDAQAKEKAKAASARRRSGGKGSEFWGNKK